MYIGTYLPYMSMDMLRGRDTSARLLPPEPGRTGVRVLRLGAQKAVLPAPLPSWTVWIALVLVQGVAVNTPVYQEAVVVFQVRSTGVQAVVVHLQVACIRLHVGNSEAQEVWKDVLAVGKDVQKYGRPEGVQVVRKDVQKDVHVVREDVQKDVQVVRKDVQVVRMDVQTGVQVVGEEVGPRPATSPGATWTSMRTDPTCMRTA